ncbi:MAG: hypothetical protein J2P41_21825, partial [Blastocatellia bacterium]|nr:hypothetical protein [Blastocatellia bacterium]
QLFSAAGNTVTIEQVDERNISKSYILTPTFQSRTQINAILPDGLMINRPALIYVANSKHIQSNEMSIVISQNCQVQPCPFQPPPLIRADNGILNAVTNTTTLHPGDVAAVYGARFSDTGNHANSGNKVIVEQYAKSPENLIVRTHTIMSGSTPAESWSEGYNRINFQLPPSLSPGRAVIYVADGQNRESTAREIVITPK